ncbi:pyridoxamine 5'-phosphate oxidase family protein [Nodularia spumigena CS-584]|jgi:pyridoxamine 5'-phosphate oxidase|uniref:Npun_F5749 family FMN-dependent PPOX-type flavoprotein n=1 Tax=Nodularia spumigena UHCC 0060 TaxID=3110300 RepID=A0ABU5UP50_NODSP|nr:Npun_F5749 family FMN-dependent PPOX-type flavoprotein [Nodularia spumigena]AHJ29601.1 Pyridoxamine-phosphate oxidase [Nodularia spumigena CCY9414]AHJ30504.1 Pyridoxamine-phosphate oxidase [Nodularia spumigena CCY9414]EAW43079.1 Pyridoxamine 5'-phosphate oxidase-related, FMN-binding protein [Nodularia spumigena CCY9414]MDB9380991.1 pyridoxamine 5'-phosphate oxidase family protein [Nodularia spumigena CS-584]MEA5524713.1 Npun_F5749 family FMN-dependent PPOX-type flavoprotein [Nodularia spumi
MSIAPWRSAIARALHRNRSLAYARYLQLATVRENNRPANRTVVFRGFLEDSNQLKFITDARSDKVDQIQQQPWAEICWYFPNTREQFRLSGCLTLIRDDNSHPIFQPARIKIWQELSDAARLQFAWPDPGKPRVDKPAAFEPSPPNPAQPVPNFCLLLLDPLEVDHLELRGEPQNRRIYCRDEQEEWSTQEINP